MFLTTETNSLIDLTELTQLRQLIHTYPEVSGTEENTARIIHEFLLSCSPTDIITHVGGYGILATWDTGKSGKTILFRAELDALPIEEFNKFAHASSNKGFSHSCGHDGHAAILCGLAQALSHKKMYSGKVILLFQPAEENGDGAKAMLADANMTTIQPDFVFALHNLPGYPMHAILIKNGSFTAAVNSIIIHLNGKTSHAAEPEHGINPAIPVAEILQESLKLDKNNIEDPNFCVITPVCVELGEKSYGISAGKASVHLTLRTWNNPDLRKLEKKIESVAKRIAKKHSIKVDFEYTQSFFANENDSDAIQIVQKSAADYGLTVNSREYPFKWGEDFGLFTTKFKGCMFGLGSGENTPALHNPDYDFPDELIVTGVKTFYGIINQLLSNR